MLRGACATVGVTAIYAVYQRTQHPLHIVWDLDETLLCSITPLSRGKEATLALSASRYFDHIDDDFDFEQGQPNTRTVLRPGAPIVLWVLRAFGSQHVYTAAQGSYTANIMRTLDPSETFSSVIHRDIVPHHDATPGVPRGKDLTRILDELGQPVDPKRTILFDNKAYNFEPQPLNGVHVRDYTAIAVEFGGDVEMLRLVLIAALAFFAPDARSILSLFRTARHERVVKSNSTLEPPANKS